VDARTGLPVVGVVGAGQLARMTQQAAIALGLSLRVLAENADDAAALVCPDVIVGDYRSLPDLEAFAAGCDVVTFDHEHVPNAHLRALADAGHRVYPDAAALLYAQDKLAMRARLSGLGVPCPEWSELPADRAVAGLADFATLNGWPLVLKAARGGYDGRGVWVVADLAEAAPVLAAAAPLLVEEAVPIRRELAAVVARSPFGQAAAWPVVETVQSDGICVQVIAPAPDLPADIAEQAQSLALMLADRLGVVGILAVELFETDEGELLVNELAMRPHNSGHWTIEGSRTSQFEQHLRAVLDYPLGATTPTAPIVVMANVLAAPDRTKPAGIDERVHHCMARWPDVKIHLYGKDWRPGRKVGHVTALGSRLDTVRAAAADAAHYLSEGDGAAAQSEEGPAA
jgi:5-(carboxyamino)imidazole ribonucleotide synthase